MAGVNFRCKTCQAQHCAVCISGNADCVKLLINMGACLEAYDLYYGTPLLVACVNQHIDCVKVLLNAGECKARLATSYWMALRCFLAYLFAVTLFISVGWEIHLSCLQIQTGLRFWNEKNIKYKLLLESWIYRNWKWATGQLSLNYIHK